MTTQPNIGEFEIIAYRLEFLQPDGRWTGPYCAEWMTSEAFAIREKMCGLHRDDPEHPDPDPTTFALNPGQDRYVCGTLTRSALKDWFGEFFAPFVEQGGHLGCYAVPYSAVAEFSVSAGQIVYQQRAATLLSRTGQAPSAPLVERIHPTKQVSR